MEECVEINTIDDLVVHYDSVDELSSGSYDRDFVSCGVIGRYSELKNKFILYYKSLNGDNETEVAQAMCRCCKELKPQGDELITWDAFFSCMARNGIDFDEVSKIIQKIF